MRSACKPVLLVMVALFVAVPFLILHAQQAQKGQKGQSQATFQVRIEYVEVDAIVHDKTGNFVADLKKDDFEVLEDGKKQNIERMEVVNVPVEPRSTVSLISGRHWEPDVYTNQTEPGRVYLIVMDDLHVNPARSLAARRIAHEFIEQNLAPNDVAALVITSGNRRASQEFTTNKRMLLDAVDRFQGRKIVSPGMASISTMASLSPEENGAATADPQRIFNARTMFDTLASLATFAGTIHNRKKTIVLIGEGPDLDLAAAPPANVDGGNTTVTSSASDAIPLARRELRERMRDFIDAANRANVTLYAFDPSMDTQGGDDMLDLASANPGDYDATGAEIVRSARVLDSIVAAQDNLRTLSTQTGGFAVISRSFPKAYQRIRDDNSHYYVLGYYPTNDKRDGKFRTIDVKVKRADVTVTARRGYVAPTNKKTEPPPVETSEGTSPALREALLSALPAVGLPITVTAAPFRGQPGTASVLLMLQTPPGSVKFVENAGHFDGNLEVSFVAVDEVGRTVGGERLELAMPLKPDMYKVVNETGLLVESRVTLPPGRYVVRVGARDMNAERVGAVHCDLEVPDFGKSPLSLSGILISSAESMAANPRPDKERSSMLAETPSVIRRFRQTDQISALAEVYDTKIATPHDVYIRATVLNEDGREVFAHEDRRSTSEIQTSAGTTGGFGYLLKVPLADIPPGEYVFHLEVRSGLQSDAPVTRETTFTVVRR